MVNKNFSWGVFEKTGWLESYLLYNAENTNEKQQNDGVKDEFKIEGSNNQTNQLL